MINEIVWLTAKDFEIKLIETFAGQQSKKVYTSSDFNDFAYLVNDIKPDVFVYDLESCLEHKEDFLEQVSNFSEDTKIVQLEMNESELLIESAKRLTRPFEFINIFKLLEE